jgi:hypothetical protein
LWEIEPSGGSHRINSDYARADEVTRGWLSRFGWLQQGWAGAQRGAERTANENGRSYRAVTVTPSGGHPVDLWFDSTNGDAVRAVRFGWFQMQTETYADYHPAAGTRLPFVITDSDGENVTRLMVDQYEISSRVGPAAYAAPEQPDDARIPAVGTTVPMNFFPQLVVTAQINGHSFDFVFDTGGHSILTPEAAKALGLKAVGSQQTGGTGAGTLLTQDTRVGELRIGDAVMRDQHFLVLPLGYSNVEQGAKPPVAGLLGLEVIERFIVRIDYRAGRMTLLPRSAEPTCASGWHDIRFSEDMPTIEGTIDGRPAPFTIDTGNNGGLMLYRAWTDREGVTAHYNRGLQALSYGAGGASHEWVMRANSFAIGTPGPGNPAIPQPIVRITSDTGGVAASRSEAGNLGTWLLANYTVTLDYGRSRACFDFVPGYVPVPYGRAGMRVIKDQPNSFLVTLVNDGGPAAEAGLRKGDRITVVSGRPSSALGSGDFALAIGGPIGSRVPVRYARDGKEAEAVLVTREMVK